MNRRLNILCNLKEADAEAGSREPPESVAR